MSQPSQSKPKIVIIGGGFTGMACASELADAGYQVTLLERNSFLGGLAAGFKESGWNSSLEYYYHHWFASDADVIHFARKWEAENDIVFKRPLTVFETKQSGFVPLDSAVALLKFPELSLLEKVRMGMALAYLKVTKNWHDMDKVTAGLWCRRFMGEKGFQAIWKPLLDGKFGTQWSEKVNMAWLWARISSRTPSLGTYKGGFQEFINRGEQALLKRGVTISKNVSSIQVSQDENKKWHVTANGEKIACDSVVVAASPFALNAILPNLSEAYKKQLSERSHLGAVVCILSLKIPLTQNQIYWYNMRKTPENPFLAVVDHSEFVPATEFGGEHLIYVADYVDPNSSEWRRSDEELVSLALKTLKKINPSLSPQHVNRHWVFRETYAQPIPEPGAGTRMLPTVVPGHPGLFHASMSHVYPWDRGTNYALALGKTVADNVTNYLRS